MKKFAKQRTTAGFTLVEVVIGSLIALILALAIGMSMRGSIKGGRMISTRFSNESSVRRTLSVVTSELRSAAKAWNGASVIESASSTEIIFYANIDSEPTTERIRYTFNNTAVVKGVKKYDSATGFYDLPETVSTTSNGLTASSTRPFLQYFNNQYNGSESAASLPSPIDISAVRLVRMTLIPASARANGAPDYYTTEVSLRSLKDNY